MMALLLIYKSPRCFLPNFESAGLSVQEKKPKLDLQDDVRENVMVRITMILRTASLLAMLAVYNMIQVRDIGPWWPSCWSSSHPDDSYQISSQLAFLFKRRSEKYFLKWWSCHDGGHLWFPIGTILTIFCSTILPRCFLPSVRSSGRGVMAIFLTFISKQIVDDARATDIDWPQ